MTSLKKLKFFVEGVNGTQLKARDLENFSQVRRRWRTRKCWKTDSIHNDGKANVEEEFENVAKLTLLAPTEKQGEWARGLENFLFSKQTSDKNHTKEQARYTLCMPRSISKDPT